MSHKWCWIWFSVEESMFLWKTATDWNSGDWSRSVGSESEPIKTYSDESCGFYEDKYTSVYDSMISCLFVWLQMSRGSLWDWVQGLFLVIHRNQKVQIQPDRCWTFEASRLQLSTWCSPVTLPIGRLNISNKPSEDPSFFVFTALRLVKEPLCDNF